MKHFRTCVCAALCVLTLIHQGSSFDLTIIHTNDVHSRIEQFNTYGSACSAADAADAKCYGGVARRQTKIKEIRASVANSLLLDAGDQFLGSLWFNLYKGKAASLFMEKLGYDAMAIGNHAFDIGDEYLASFLDNVTFSVLSANMAVTSGSVLDGKFAASTTLTVGGEKIGIVGYIPSNTPVLAHPSKNVSFIAVLPAVRAEVDRLTGAGVNKIIALGHAGYDEDLLVAEIEGVDVVVGGHTHTFLYTGEPPSNEVPLGPYPAVVTRSSGRRALVVQDYTWAKYLGVLNVTFDDVGEVASWSGNPVILDGSISEDPEIKAVVDEWGQPVMEQNAKVVGSSKVYLEGRRQICRIQECNMANLFLDSLVDFFLDFPHSNTTWAPAAIAIWNAGGIRASINKGAVTIGDVTTVLPFKNEVDLVVLKGSKLREMLEQSVRNLNLEVPTGGFLHFSGLRVEYDIRSVEKRVLSVELRCLECDVPSYSLLDDSANYKILVNTFLVEGGDGYNIVPIERVRFNREDYLVLSTYFERHSPVAASLDGRIVFKNPDDDTTSATPGYNVPSVLVLALVCVATMLLFTG